MNRERLAWTVSVALLAVVSFEIPGSLARRDDDYGFVRTLVDIHRRVADNYVDPVDEQRLNEGAIDGMLAQLDPYSDYYPPEKEDEFKQMLTGNLVGIGVELNQRPDGTIEVVTPLDDSPAARAGIQPGDVLLGVDGKDLPEGEKLADLILRIKGKVGSKVSLTVRHADGGPPATYTVERAEVHRTTVKGYQRRPDNAWDYLVCDDPKVGYVRLTQFTGNSYDELRAVFEQVLKDGAKGIVLDLRFNPGGELGQAEQILDMLVPKGSVLVSTRGRARPEQKTIATGENPLPKFPLIVLVDEHSASAAEIVAGSLQDNRRAMVVGTRTFGKGSVQEVIPLDDKAGELKLTVAHWYLPSGRLIHRVKDATDWGINPQVVVPMTAAQERKVLEDQAEQEKLRRPLAKVVAGPTTTATTQPAGIAADPQLQAAVNTMLGVLLFESTSPGPATRAAR